MNAFRAYSLGIISVVLFLLPLLSMAQINFPELVEKAHGSNQELVNGIQFSNHYGRIEGHPYFTDPHFREGSLIIHNQWYEQVQLRYNIYSQKLEMEYLTLEGNLNQLMLTSEKISSFTLAGIEFRRMHFPEDSPGYYQYISSPKTSCYIGWTKELLPSGSSGFYQHEFSSPIRHYWISLDQQMKRFEDRKTYVRAFPPRRQKDFKKLLKKEKYSFKHASAREMVDFVKATLQLYDSEPEP